jgi:dCMP deaminase
MPAAQRTRRKTTRTRDRSALMWDERRLKLAHFVAEWSKDPDAKVGAVIADAHGRVIALGYNGFAVGIEDSADRLGDTDQKLDMIVHAEQNAVLIAGRAAEGATIYVVGKPVCSRCAGVIIQSGIKRVVAQAPGNDLTSKWTKPGLVALAMFAEAKVEFVPAEDP